MRSAIANSEELGRLTLRIALGSMWLSHGLVLKALTFGLSGFAGWLASIGLPSWLALPIMLAEIVGGALILLGWHGRAVSLALLPILLGAIWVHAGNGWVFTATNGGWEYPLFLAVVTIVHVLVGDGAYALSAAGARSTLAPRAVG
jgi:putative oxidoreductase